MFYQTLRQLPFYMVTAELNPQEEHMGMVSTRFLVSLPTQKFDAYMQQLGHDRLRENSRFSLQDGRWPSEVTTALAIAFDRQLTRLLLHYLDVEGNAHYHQKVHMARHVDTRLNFAALIGCAVYADSTEFQDNATLVEAIEAGLEDGSADFGNEDCSLLYYGFALKSHLLSECKRLRVGKESLAASLRRFRKDFVGLKAIFKGSKNRGFGAQEASPPRGSQEERPGGFIACGWPRLTAWKETSQPVHSLTPELVARNHLAYFESQPLGEKNYRFDFSTAKTEDFAGGAKRSPS